jgi:hypothetical protein
MPIITLPAHYDGKKICLDELYSLKPNTKLIITILPEQENEDERQAWYNLSECALERAYGDNEPDYGNIQLKEKNPLYEGR